MGKKVGVLILHGVGVQDEGYSIPMQEGIKTVLNNFEVDAEQVEFKEVVYSDIFDINQEERSAYMVNTSSKFQLITRGIRRLMVFIFSDAVSYRACYKKVHKRLSDNIKDLQKKLVKGAPVIVAAHSMGVIAISDYIYDQQEKKHIKLKLEKISNLKALITFGCNIPLFEMGYEDTVCIKRPETDKAGNFFWTNFYSPFDVLGYRVEEYYTKRPLPDFPIKDVKVFPGCLCKFWNILSHTTYWRHEGIQEFIGETIKKILIREF